LIPLLARPRAAVTVTLVRETLLDTLIARLPQAAPRVVGVDAADRERAWAELSGSVFEGADREAGRC
jgi:hypothetical protein